MHFLATVSQMFGGPSQLPTTTERVVIKSNRWTHFRQQSRKLGGAAEHLIDGSENAFVVELLAFYVTQRYALGEGVRRGPKVIENALPSYWVSDSRKIKKPERIILS